jgi:hypothetical protein
MLQGSEPTPYLIAHKVRGERAFDVAIRLDIGSEIGWIIPTSGHRAYPYWWTELDPRWLTEAQPPKDCPDHYRCINQTREQSSKAAQHSAALELEQLLKDIQI